MPAPSSPPSLTCGHTKGKILAQSPQELAEASLSCFLRNVLFSRSAKDAKITFHLCGLSLSVINVLLFLCTLNQSARKKDDALVMTHGLIGKL